MADIKLISGREVVLKPINFPDKMKLYRLALEYATEHPKAKVNPEVLGEALICVGLSTDELNTWSIAEIIEGGNKVYESLEPPEAFKKK